MPNRKPHLLKIIKRPGQSILEYSVIIGLVATALIVMQVYMKRGIQAATKAAADQLSLQNAGEIINLEKGGYLIGANAFGQANSVRSIETGRFDPDAPIDTTDTQTKVSEFTNTFSNAVYNLGIE